MTQERRPHIAAESAEPIRHRRPMADVGDARSSCGRTVLAVFGLQLVAAALGGAAFAADGAGLVGLAQRHSERTPSWAALMLASAALATWVTAALGARRLTWAGYWAAMVAPPAIMLALLHLTLGWR